MLLLEWINCMLAELFEDVRNSWAIHYFEGLKYVTELCLGLFEKGQHVAPLVTGDHCQVSVVEHGWAKKGALCDYTQSSFRADEQVLEVVSCVILAQSGHVV